MKNHWSHLRYAAVFAVASVAIPVILGACGASSGSAATQTSSQTTAPPPTTSPQPQAPNNSGGRLGGGATGTIASISGTTFTLTTQQGDVTVNVGANAAIQKTVAGSLSDLQTGQFITATGTVDASGNVAAASVSLRGNDAQRFTPPSGATPNPSRPGGFSGTPRSPNGAFGNGVFGTISAANGNTLTVTTGQSQQVTVTVDASTRITKTVAGTMSDLQVGEPVSVGGTLDSNGVLQATFITIRPEAGLAGG